MRSWPLMEELLKAAGLVGFLVETAQYRGLLWKLPNAANVKEIIGDLAGNRVVWCNSAHSFTAVLQSCLRRQRGPPDSEHI